MCDGRDFDSSYVFYGDPPPPVVACSNCNAANDGSVDFYDDLCEECHERAERIKALVEDHKNCGDFDYSMNH